MMTLLMILVGEDWYATYSLL